MQFEVSRAGTDRKCTFHECAAVFSTSAKALPSRRTPSANTRPNISRLEETPYVLDWKKGSDDCHGTRNDSCFGWMRGRTFVDCVLVEYPLMR
ncbi:MAG: hypothetical protein QOK03_3110 [Candidatus Binataceae bacterium]|jgi:hypothetical protein|nr:hypothetical protein [Candidatus Binataceae bacterium]